MLKRFIGIEDRGAGLAAIYETIAALPDGSTRAAFNARSLAMRYNNRRAAGRDTSRELEGLQALKAAMTPSDWEAAMAPVAVRDD